MLGFAAAAVLSATGINPAFGTTYSHNDAIVISRADTSVFRSVAAGIAAKTVANESVVRGVMLGRALDSYVDTAHQTAPAQASVRRRTSDMTVGQAAAALRGKVNTHN
jgi:hypothetical protein